VHSIVGAGAIVKERDIIPPHSIAFGIPAKVKKSVSEEIQDDIQQNAETYVKLAKAYRRRLQN
jgi:carbonic anhydrase/acetyltransferase-like protein (isoleucine patch superfamily)